MSTEIRPDGVIVAPWSGVDPATGTEVLVQREIKPGDPEYAAALQDALRERELRAQMAQRFGDGVV